MSHFIADEYYTCKEPGCLSITRCDDHPDKHGKCFQFVPVSEAHDMVILVVEREFALQDVAKRNEDEIRARALTQPPSEFKCESPCFMAMTREDQVWGTSFM